MLGTVNAAGLLAVIALTVVVLVRHGRRSSWPWAVVVGLLWAGLALVLGVVFTTHMCNAGQPLTQLLVPACCLAIAYPLLDGYPARRVLLVTLFLAPVVLGLLFTSTVHTSEYTGNPLAINKAYRAMQRSTLNGVQAHFQVLLDNEPRFGERRYLAGPLADSEAWALLKVEEDEESLQYLTPYLTSHTATPYHLWHTWLTGIHGVRSAPLVLWYPGGTLREALPRLSYRPPGA